MNDPEKKPRGPWLYRCAIRFLGVVLAVLIYWLLGFVVDDIGSVRGPAYGEIEKKHVDPAMLQQQKKIGQDIEGVDRNLSEQREVLGILGERVANLQTTIDQLLEVQKLSLQKEVVRSEAEQQTFSKSLTVFLSNQQRVQEISEDIARLTAEKRTLQRRLDEVEKVLARQREPARSEHRDLMRRHGRRLATLQLAVLIPLLVVGSLVLIKWRGSVYLPLLLAFGAAVLLKVCVVIHKHFPMRFFKYILIAACIGVVVKVLIHLIRFIAYPKAQWLAKQYREGYERFLCPICEYPIRRGPMKFLFWTRRSVARLRPSSPAGTGDEPYMCPSCGTGLFSPCPACGKVRHALLGYCEHCGTEQESPETPAVSVVP